MTIECFDEIECFVKGVGKYYIKVEKIKTVEWVQLTEETRRENRLFRDCKKTCVVCKLFTKKREETISLYNSQSYLNIILCVVYETNSGGVEINDFSSLTC